MVTVHSLKVKILNIYKYRRFYSLTVKNVVFSTISYNRDIIINMFVNNSRDIFIKRVWILVQRGPLYHPPVPQVRRLRGLGHHRP